LISRKTVFENVTYLPRVLGVDLKQQKQLAYQALRRVGLAHRMNAFPPQLSGGEQQRVAIARALINDPDILIADEPTGNLDPDLSREILRLFLEVNLRGTTVVLATHDRETIQRIGRRVLTLDRGQLASDVTLFGTDPPDLSPSARRPPGEAPEAEESTAGPAGSREREEAPFPAGPLAQPSAAARENGAVARQEDPAAKQEDLAAKQEDLAAQQKDAAGLERSP
jgi:ABC-type methionine transport system ATPase subunit